ncbi:MAG: hypothetical protein AAF170_01810 [Bacteroidota bacterium]
MQARQTAEPEHRTAAGCSVAAAVELAGAAQGSAGVGMQRAGRHVSAAGDVAVEPRVEGVLEPVEARHRLRKTDPLA